MSDIPAGGIDLRAELARIDRDRLEMQKVLGEVQKLAAETQKLNSETFKLNSEGHKFDRERWILPITVFGGILAAIIARLPEILRAFGVP